MTPSLPTYLNIVPHIIDGNALRIGSNGAEKDNVLPSLPSRFYTALTIIHIVAAQWFHIGANGKFFNLDRSTIHRPATLQIHLCLYKRELDATSDNQLVNGSPHILPNRLFTIFKTFSLVPQKINCFINRPRNRHQKPKALAKNIYFFIVCKVC